MPEVTKGMSFGGQNAYRFTCNETEQEAGYGLCQILIDMVRGGTMIPPSYEPCKKMIQSEKCPALHMQREEKAAGHDLYFKPWRPPAVPGNPLVAPRNVMVEKINLGFTPKDVSDEVTVITGGSKVGKSELSDMFSEAPTYADAINTTMKETIASDEAKRPLSLMERAKLMSKGK